MAAVIVLPNTLGRFCCAGCSGTGAVKSKDFAFKRLQEVRTDAKVTALINGRMAASDTGELQITNYGISGIPVFQVSRYISRALYEKKNAQVMIDFLPELEEASLRELFSKSFST